MTKIIIIGGKGSAVNIGEQIVDARERFGSKSEFIGWAIDDESLGQSIGGYPVLCKPRELVAKFPFNDVGFIFALYKPEEMKERVALLKSYGISLEKFVTFVHPTTYVARSAKVGEGTVILANSTINSNVTIGNFNIINSNIVIEHDSVIEKSNFIAASVCVGSHVFIQNGVFIGLDSTIKENLEIGDFAYVGMGSNVIRSVGVGETVVGNPARPI